MINGILNVGFIGVQFLGNENVRFGSVIGFEVDFSDVMVVMINEFRQVFQVQSLFEFDVCGGICYVEIFQVYYNVILLDF